jgi:prepilin signal peptidase PulO-like enzyme (type II secretory pathway)
MGVVFGVVYWWWPLADYWLIGVFLVMVVGFGTLFIYDAKFGRLPEKPLIFLIICAIMWVILKEWRLFVSVGDGGGWNGLGGDLLGLAGALVVLPGLYYILYKASRERLVGSGDYLLALPIALVLGDFWLAFVVVFLANFLGCLVMVPMAAKGKKIREDMHISFGPFLIVAFLVVFLMRDFVLGWFRF